MPKSTTAAGAMLRNGSSPRESCRRSATYAPPSPNAPCARLTTFITPQTREKPTAISASSPPCRRPYNVACRNWDMSSPVPLPDCRPRHRRLGRVLRPHRHSLAVLDLHDAHRLGDVHALRVEL